MSGECNYCQGDHAEAKCDADRGLVYENGRAAGRADGLNRVESRRWLTASHDTRLSEAAEEIKKLRERNAMLRKCLLDTRDAMQSAVKIGSLGLVAGLVSLLDAWIKENA